MNLQALTALLFVTLAGCSSDGDAAPPDPASAPAPVPSSLDLVKIAPTFAFATTRSVAVHLAPPAGAAVQGVELRRVSGELVYAGGAPAGGARFNLPLPLHESRLRVAWQMASGETSESIVVVGEQGAEVAP